MTEFLDGLDKAELHIHLEGSADFEVLSELAPELSETEIRRACAFTDFAGFIEAYKFVVQRLRSPEHYALLTRRLLRRMEQQRVRYAEINLSVGVMLWKRQEVGPIFDAIAKEAAESTVRVGWIFDAVRQFGAEEAVRVAELAAERSRDGVVGFGIGGDEARGEAGSFRPACDIAARNGVHFVPHAGETTTAQSIWDMLRLGAVRIGHGIRSVEDPALLRHLRDQQIPLEICITSNVCTGAIARLEDHPVRRIFDQGVPITLNTDDPGLFETTLTREYEIAMQEFGFSEAELRGVAENGFRFGLKQN